ncbi:hypothetical protein BFP70_19230 [Thioclava sp. SK-1]|nr:hypothetical protein BFP70_19230 [Thioclava sp. SK-1]
MIGLALCAWPTLLFAEAQSLVTRGSLFDGAAGTPLIQRASVSSAAGPSLFAGQSGGSLLAPVPKRVTLPDGVVQASFVPQAASLGGFSPYRPNGRGSFHADRIRHLIAQAEAGPAGYDAVQYGATRRPAKRPTRMTIAEIYAWIKATPGQPHAIGRYQFIPATLRRLVNHLGVDERTTFTPALQDRLADLLLEEAGLSQAMAGNLSRTGFMNNLAKIWAGLPNSSGKSHYDGYAGNHATMSWAKFDGEMARIFPG